MLEEHLTLEPRTVFIADQDLCAPKSKRLCGTSLFHDSFPQQAPPYFDRLQGLYPHSRDNDCFLDEKSHKYHVLGAQYNLSVSGWWKKYFEEFNAIQVSDRILQRYREDPGFRTAPSGEASEDILSSSIYNFAQHIFVFKRGGDNDFLAALRDVALASQDDYTRRGGCCPFSVDLILEYGRRFLLNPKKVQGPSCYYLMLLYTASSDPRSQTAQIIRTWELYCNLESLKGTYLHKQIQLFINAMARPMERDGTSYIAVEHLLREQPPADEYKTETVLEHIAWAQDPDVWNHPLAQRFFKDEMLTESLEFLKFRSWLASKPRWTPIRSEWSLYNEDLQVAGQIDSLWFDLEPGGGLVMADWKRTRLLLTDDVNELQQQSFGKMGTSCCSHLYDTVWSHYFVQQTLYAYLLASKLSLIHI